MFDDDDMQSGSYDVNLVVISDTVHSCAQPIACGQVLDGSIGLKGESDTFRISGAAGDVVKIDTTITGGQLNACWEFYDPTGASLGGACGADDRTLATTLAGYTLRCVRWSQMMPRAQRSLRAHFLVCARVLMTSLAAGIVQARGAV